MVLFFKRIKNSLLKQKMVDVKIRQLKKYFEIYFRYIIRHFFFCFFFFLFFCLFVCLFVFFCCFFFFLGGEVIVNWDCRFSISKERHDTQSSHFLFRSLMVMMITTNESSLTHLFQILIKDMA